MDKELNEWMDRCLSLCFCLSLHLSNYRSFLLVFYPLFDFSFIPFSSVSYVGGEVGGKEYQF